MDIFIKYKCQKKKELPTKNVLKVSLCVFFELNQSEKLKKKGLQNSSE